MIAFVKFNWPTKEQEEIIESAAGYGHARDRQQYFKGAIHRATQLQQLPRH
jgi:hypothetical protein